MQQDLTQKGRIAQYAQVDWGHFRAQFPDSSAIKLYAFVFTLAYSRTTYAEWTTSMDLATLQHCHQRAFEYVGGIPKCLVYDRMKTVVLGGDDRGHPRIHPAFLDFAGHYGFVPQPAPPRWPRGKGKVESGVKYVRRNLWQGLDWAGKSVWVRLVRDDWVVVTAGGQVISEHPLEPVLRRTVIDDVHHDSCGGGRATGRCKWCLG